MRILTYNVHGWLTTAGEPNVDAVARLIGDTRADIVGLNEVFHPHAFPPGDKSALAILADKLSMSYVFGPCLRWPATADLPDRSFGNALLSRWPILASAAHHLTSVEGKEQRSLLEARIALPEGQTFTVYVTHLDHTAEAARMVQVRALRTWTVRDRNRPHLVLGDFNAISPWDFAQRPVALAALAHHPVGGQLVDGERGPQVAAQMEKTGYVDAWRRFGIPGQETFIPAEQPLRIDYIWVSEPLAPHLRDCQIWQEPAGQEASDHRPVLVDIEF